MAADTHAKLSFGEPIDDPLPELDQDIDGVTDELEAPEGSYTASYLASKALSPTLQAVLRDYVEKSIKPRRGESVYSYECRKASSARGIELWMLAVQDSEFNVSRASMLLGISPGNTPAMWRRLKLTRNRLKNLLQRGNDGSNGKDDE